MKYIIANTVWTGEGDGAGTSESLVMKQGIRSKSKPLSQANIARHK